MSGGAGGGRRRDGHLGGSEIWFDATDCVIGEVTISGNTMQATVQTGGANIGIIGADFERPQRADSPKMQKVDTAHLINITGNTIYDSADLSVFAARSAGIVVCGNTFVWRGNDSEPPEDGLRFEECDNVLLNGLATQRFCAGSAERGAAVTLDRCSNRGVSDCQILNPLHRGLELETASAADSPTTRLSIAACYRR